MVSFMNDSLKFKSQIHYVKNASKFQFAWKFIKMVVVTSLGPPEEGIRHVQAGTTTFINKVWLSYVVLVIT